MTKLLDEMKKEQSVILTENGQPAMDTTMDPLVDLFGMIGAMRWRQEDLPVLFQKAMNADPLLAVKMAFYARDVREGLGERSTGRTLFRYLAAHYPDIMRKNLSQLVEMGRYDDLLVLFDTDVEEDVVALIRKQLEEDIAAMRAGKPVSLLAKWLPSGNTSSHKTRTMAKKVRNALGLSAREYRHVLSGLRAYMSVTEVALSAKNYDFIRYESVPAVAMNRYRNAFARNDNDRFAAYAEALKEGKTTVKAGVLYPYDITEKFLYGRNILDKDPAGDVILEEQWKALPDYVSKDSRYLVMADVSGSMYGRPLATSVGLAMYFAERNTGPFANTFMTFSAKPRLEEITGNTLREKLTGISRAEWDMNTDLEAAFLLVLSSAVNAHVSKEEMPTHIIVISDMEIDECTNIDHWNFYEGMKRKYAENGYEIPIIVFWNVSSHQNTFFVSYDTPGVQLASGHSVSVFRSIMEEKEMTPLDVMLKTLNAERYSHIVV